MNVWKIRSRIFRSHVKLLMQRKEFLHRGLLISMFMLPEAVGKEAFHTRTPELQLSELVKGGITTVVGLLGTDGLTRSVENLYAKVQALCEEGVSAYMLTGAYGYPSPTITGEVDRDIMFVEKVLGVKLANFRSSGTECDGKRTDPACEQDQNGRYVKRKTWNRGAAYGRCRCWDCRRCLKLWKRV